MQDPDSTGKTKVSSETSKKSIRQSARLGNCRIRSRACHLRLSVPKLPRPSCTAASPGSILTSVLADRPRDPIPTGGWSSSATVPMSRRCHPFAASNARKAHSLVYPAPCLENALDAKPKPCVPDSTSFDDLDQSCACQRSLGLLAVAFAARSLTAFRDRSRGVASVSNLVRDLRREARVGLREINNRSIRSTCTPSRPLSQERRDASRHDRARANAAQPNGYVAE